MRYLYTILFTIIVARSQGQNPVSYNISNQNGLPSNAVYNLLQDSKGFIWMGHDKGLSRFDGSRFTHYTAPAQQGKSLSNLMELDNSIWCQDFSGNFYYTQGTTLHKETTFKSTGAFSPAGQIETHLIASINYDSIKSFDTQTRYKKATATVHSSTQAVFHSKKDKASYFFYQKNLMQFDGQTATPLYKYAETLPSFSFLVKCGSHFYAFNRKTAPLCYKFTPTKAEPLAILKPGTVVQDVTLVGQEIWVSTVNGAYCFDTNMQPLYGGLCFFPENSITQIMRDREGNYWFGTLNKGALIVPDIHTALFRYGTESITALSSYKNSDILAGTASHLIFTFNTNTTAIQTIIENDSKGEILSLLYDSRAQTIVSCANTTTLFRQQSKFFEDNIAGKQACKIDDDTYALAFAGGITLLDKAGRMPKVPTWLRPYTHTENKRVFLTQGFRGRAVLFDPKTQTLYTATSEGLRYYTAQTQGLITCAQKPIYAAALCLAGGRLYAGTFSDGLMAISGQEAKVLNPHCPRLTATVYRLCAEGNYLWLIGDDCVQRYHIFSHTVQTYNVADGLPKGDINDVMVANGWVYLATDDGLMRFNTQKSDKNTTPPLLELTDFWINDKPIGVYAEHTFEPDENNIELALSVLTFKDNKAATVSYRLNGQEWKTLPAGNRQLQLAALAAGHYTLEIRAFNEDLVPSKTPIFVRFSIKAPIYKQVWFVFLVVITLLAAMYAYFKQQLRLQEKSNALNAQKMALEQELQKSLLSSIKSQMNPHFLFNALNTIQAYIYTNEKENASFYLGKFSELTRLILDMSNKEKISLAEEIKALGLYIELEELRFEDKLNYSLTIDPSVSTQTIFIPSMLVQPYVENAIKHGLMHSRNQWQLDINFIQKNDIIEITIDDNGVGRSHSQALNVQKQKKHLSFASDANQKRLDILNKGLKKAIGLEIIDKTDAYGQALGTTVVLRIPI